MLQNWGKISLCNKTPIRHTDHLLITFISLSWEMSDICSYLRKNFTKERPEKL